MGTTSFSYDEQNRLRSWTTTNGGGGYGSTFIGLDAWGNRLFTAVKGCAGVAAGCYVSSIIPAQISGTTNHYAGVTYDDTGSVTNDGRLFAYDPLGMMASASVSGRQFQYLYTADDERIGIVEVTSPASPAYTWTIRGFGSQLLRTYTGAGSGMTWGEDEIWRGGVLLANERPSVGTRHYALDHLGSPRSVTSSSGTMLGQQLFQPFGAGGTTDGGALQFTGQERDMDLFGSGTTNLPDYFHARYYDVQGRFLSVDPVIDVKRAIRNPRMWNRYAYAVNNPIRYNDPTGKELPFDPNMFNPPHETVGQSLMAGAMPAAVMAAVVLGPEIPAIAISAFTNFPRAFMWLSELGAGAAGMSANLEQLSNAGGPSVRLVTNLTQSPQEGRALSAAAGEGAEALANAARSGEGVKTFVGNVPTALLQGLRQAGLLEVRTTEINGVRATEYRFFKGASQYIIKFFNEQKPTL